MKYFAFIFAIIINLRIDSRFGLTKYRVILVDDWGYGDASSKLSGVPLPAIDAIAKAGVTTNGYAWPARAHPAALSISRLLLATDRPLRQPAHCRPTGRELWLAGRCGHAGQSLHQLGYVIGMFGKWHMGKRPDQHQCSAALMNFSAIGSSHSISVRWMAIPCYVVTHQNRSPKTDRCLRPRSGLFHSSPRNPTILYLLLA